MNKSSVFLLLSVLMASVPALAGQSKYLGKNTEEEKEKEEVTYPKVNLLSSEIITKNPHLLNQEFWLERNSSEIISPDSAPKELSEELFDIVKENASVSPHNDAVSDDKEENKDMERGKDFVPPKTALIGYDHHHKYSQVKQLFGDDYNSSVFSASLDGETVLFKTTGKKWAIGNERQPVLVTDISISSDSSVNYLKLHSEIALVVAKNFMESLLPISEDDLSFYVLNKNKDELSNPKYSHVLRDICIKNISSSEVLAVRMKVKTSDMSVKNLRVFSGMECGA